MFALAGLVLAVLAVGTVGFFWLFGGTLLTILFLEVDRRVDLDAAERLPRGGPNDVLMQPVPRLADAGLAGAPVTEAAYRFPAARGAREDGWERVYASDLSRDGQLTLRLDGARTRIREIELPKPARPASWEGLAGPKAWGPPAKTTSEGAAHVSRWTFRVEGGGVVRATVRWHGDRPGALDAITWTREDRPRSREHGTRNGPNRSTSPETP